jgi:hypothetical protein
LTFNASGAAILAVLSAWTGSTIQRDGSVLDGGIEGLTIEQNKRKNVRRYRMQRYGVPVEWLLFVAGFVLQLIAFL